MSKWLSSNLYKLGFNDWAEENHPTADSASNDHLSDVIGNKSDAAVTLVGVVASIIAYVKGILNAISTNNTADQIDLDAILEDTNTTIPTTIATIDAFHDVPGANSADNVVMSDVIGDKTDTHAGDSIYAQVKELIEYTHNASKVYPTMEDGVTVTSNAAAWTLGNAVTIVGTSGKTLDNLAAADQGGDPNVVRIPSTGHGYVVGNNVTIAGSTNYNGTFEVVAVSDADHFDIEIAFNAETFGGTETVIDVIPTDFDLHFISIENLSANGVYELVIYDDGVEWARNRFTKNANLDGTLNVPIQGAIIAASSVITAKLATNNAAGDTATVSIFYHSH